MATPDGKLDIAPHRFGKVEACDGNLVEACGLPLSVGTHCLIGARMRGSGHQAEVIGFRNGRTLLSLFGDPVLLTPGSRVWASGPAGQLLVGEQMLGRVVNGQGLAADEGPPVILDHAMPIDGRRDHAMERTSITKPFDTGLKAVDSLMTMGVGQKMGIIAGSGVGKSVLIEMIAHNAYAEIVILGMIGERGREVSDLVRSFRASRRRAQTAIVAVPADHAPALRLRGAKLAMALAEHFRDQGKRVLLIMDSLTRVAHAAREIGLMIGESPAARGYPPSALATITRLIERAGNSRSTGGSITALFTVLADGDDMNDPVVDTARAILDGHLVLRREIAQQGRYPALDIGASLSRVMQDVASEETLSLARRLRTLDATYETNRDLIMMGAYREGRDELLDEAIRLRPRIQQFLSQGRDETFVRAQSQTCLRECLSEADE